MSIKSKNFELNEGIFELNKGYIFVYTLLYIYQRKFNALFLISKK